MSNPHLSKCAKDLQPFVDKIVDKIEVSWNTIMFKFKDGSILEVEAQGPPGVDLIYAGRTIVNISGDLSRTQNDE